MKRKYLYKAFISMFIFTSLFVPRANIANAKQVSIKDLNAYLLKSGGTQELVNSWEYDQKLKFYEQKGTLDQVNTQYLKLNPDTKIFEEISPYQSLTDQLSPLASSGTISPTQLKLSLSVGDHILYDGTKYKWVVFNYEWVNPTSLYRGTSGDKIGISMPAGWRLIPNSYECVEYQSGWPASGWTIKGNGGGRPFDIGEYGAVWSLTGTDNVWHKGWVAMDVQRFDSSAQNRVMGKYVQDVGASTSWSFTYGPASLGITGNKTNNQAPIDSSFVY